MRIYQRKPDSIIRISVNKQGESSAYITLCDTDQQEVCDYLKTLISKQNLSPFFTGRKTSITIREAIGSKNGKSINLSFTGLTPAQTIKLITDDLTKDSLT